MTGWNLPPGCSVRDLPGNSPAEQGEERHSPMRSADKFETKMSEELLNELIE